MSGSVAKFAHFLHLTVLNVKRYNRTFKYFRIFKIGQPLGISAPNSTVFLPYNIILFLPHYILL